MSRHRADRRRSLVPTGLDPSPGLGSRPDACRLDGRCPKRRDRTTTEQRRNSGTVPSDLATYAAAVQLNPEQQRAVDAVRGPVCILAGAGSGKTTTITHRIANQVATSTFGPEQILAVTFTEKAARAMRTRLGSLGASGVRARTFHSAALAQLRSV